ncbi:hypothetical protein [Leptospira interrogans]|uniref:hypothetical protein n=1 Tax=Leptospira interrogans TaxID=173 RepID=UPI00051A02C1|nr:hypothetical protein [Leptospira interrogans]QOI36814.1 hypothetical protein LeptoLang_21755 [Leptospira interrogans serovar Icterohaemorrhagiae]
MEELESFREDLKTETGFTDVELDRLESEFCALPVSEEQKVLYNTFFAIFVYGAMVQRDI